MKICKECKIEFKPNISTQKFCCNKCRDKFNDRKKRKKREDIWKIELKCPYCEIIFMPNRKNQKYCCRNHMLSHHSEIAQVKKKESRKISSVKINPELKKNYNKCRIICKDIVRALLKKDKRYVPSKVILGYSKEEFCEHIEKQFKDNMNWGNHGSVWQIDHIRPIASFRLSESDIDYNFKITKECNSLSNLMPVFKEINNRKSSWYKNYYWSNGFPIKYKDSDGKIHKVKEDNFDTIMKEVL